MDITIISVSLLVVAAVGLGSIRLEAAAAFSEVLLLFRIGVMPSFVDEDRVLLLLVLMINGCHCYEIWI